ncbi:hypothetical protein WOLCODRAFT_64537 [Wolfiporia cocos MD-104 SS10]|uniref:AN1-type domain-containing protein n=1 Tax=Wolfiporia cocos (strain MD-104) TaxID=742152 RepID=A0A2H3JQ64_WOLCO|nr:hypothetical protein WOLCODRAFT_64537 [Wolfiporia cocos MD-104 SS10]
MPTIGAHCSVSTCNVNDFLPIRCKCDLLFCKDHIAPELHSCGVDPSVRDPILPVPPKRQKCAAQGCTKPSLESAIADSADVDNRIPAVCPRCKSAFCAAHRNPASHDCPVSEPAHSSHTKNAAARALLAKNFPSSSRTGSTNSQSPTTPAAAARKTAQSRQIELIKMRSRAQPGDLKDKSASVAMSQRVHVNVVRGDVASRTGLYWFRKETGTGKALDLLANHLGMSTARPLQLVRPDESAEAVLQTDRLLSDQIEDGASLRVEYRS